MYLLYHITSFSYLFTFAGFLKFVVLGEANVKTKTKSAFRHCVSICKQRLPNRIIKFHAGALTAKGLYWRTTSEPHPLFCCLLVNAFPPNQHLPLRFRCTKSGKCFHSLCSFSFSFQLFHSFPLSTNDGRLDHYPFCFFLPPPPFFLLLYSVYFRLHFYLVRGCRGFALIQTNTESLYWHTLKQRPEHFSLSRDRSCAHFRVVSLFAAYWC